MANIERRIASAEKALAEHGDGLVIIHVSGGLTDDASNGFATAGGVEFQRGDGEDPMQFRERMEHTAREMGASCLVFGGLPRPTYDTEKRAVAQ